MSYATIYKNHGIQVNLFGKKDAYTILNSRQVEFDIQGSVFKCLGTGLNTLAQLLLPFSLSRFPTSSFEYSKTNVNCQFGIGIRRLNHDVLNSTLDKIVKNGDPPFQIELIHNYTETVCTFITKASLIQSSLKTGSDIVYKGQDVKSLIFKKRSMFLGFIRWWLFAWIFMVTVWVLHLSPNQVHQAFPYKLFSGIPAAQKSYIQEIPPFPDNMEEAYEYGNLVSQFEMSQDNESKENILLQAAKLAKREKVSKKELFAIKQEIIDFQNKKGIVQRIRGFFTFINILWLFSIIGITVSIGPCTYDLLKPIREYLKQFLKKLWKHIICPFCEMLHNRGILEFTSYYISTYFVVEGFRMNKEIGFFITLTGLAFTFISFYYSSIRHLKKLRINKTEEELRKMVFAWLAVCLLSFAIHFDNSFFGFATVFCIYYILIVNTLTKYLCILIDFDDRNYLHRIIGASFFLLVSYSLLQIFDIKPSFFKPFDYGINVMGTFAFFFAMFINSSYWQKYTWKLFIYYQFAFFVSLIASLAFGLLYGNEEIINLTITFGFLYVLQKYSEIHFEYRFSGWIYAFIISVIFWRIALWCHLHPTFLISIFQSFTHTIIKEK